MSVQTREGKAFIQIQQVHDIDKTYKTSANFYFMNLPEPKVISFFSAF
jgi:hypothetical protein